MRVGDRESDIYELFCLAEEPGTNSLVRACVDRLAESRHRKVSQTLEEAPLLATYDVTFVNATGKSETATLEMKWRRIRVLPSDGLSIKAIEYPIHVADMINQRLGDAKALLQPRWQQPQPSHEERP